MKFFVFGISYLFSKDGESAVPNPSDRQEEGDQETDPLDEGKPGDKKNKYKPVPSGIKKSLIKSEIVATTLKDKKGTTSVDGDNPSPGITTFRTVSYSGNDEASRASSRSSGNVVDSREARNGTRFRNKRNLPIRDINDNISEQSFLEIEALPSLGRSSGPEGYNGTRRSNNAMVQKRSGGHVASPVFSRSLDGIFRDRLLFTHGQVIKVTDREYFDTPTYSLDSSLNEGSNNLVRGNYVPRKLKIGFDENHNLINMHFEVDDITTYLSPDQEEIANKSALHEVIHLNRAELERQAIEENAGDETKPDWSPLARAIKEPTRYMSYLKDVEQDTGNTVLMAYNKLATALAYQNNKTAKDGLTHIRPIKEAVLSSIVENNDSHVYDGMNLFDYDNMKKGTADLFIAMFDSVAKYDSKGAFLNLPKSWKSVLPIAEKHATTFRASEQFNKLMRNNQIFGPIMSDYDPTQPVYGNDDFVLAHPHDWSKQLSFTNGVFDHDVMGISYSDVRNNYYTEIKHPLLQGIFDYVKRFSYNFAKAVGEIGNAFEITIPITYSNTKISMWEVLVLAATQYIRAERIDSMREVIDYSDNHTYPFQKLIQLDGLLTGGGKGIGYKSINEPLELRKLDTLDSLSFIWPELFSIFDETSLSGNWALLPWYFNEAEFTFLSNGSWNYTGVNPNMSFPIHRSGLRLDYADIIHSIDPRTLRLSLDRLTLPPLASGTNANAKVYKYDGGTDGLIAMLIDGAKISYGDILSLPRELGLAMTLPYGYAGGAHDEANDYFVDIDAQFEGQSSYKAVAYFSARDAVPSKLPWSAPEEGLNSQDDINNKTGANFVQDYQYAYAGKNGDNLVNDIPLSFGANFYFNANGDTMEAIYGRTAFRPFVSGYKSSYNTPQAKVTEDEFTLVSFSKMFWARLSLMRFVLNPWDSVKHVARLNEEDGLKIDPYDFSYMFNHAGFYASDYSESVEIRKEKINTEGLYFTEDDWLEESYMLA